MLAFGDNIVFAKKIIMNTATCGSLGELACSKVILWADRQLLHL